MNLNEIKTARDSVVELYVSPKSNYNVWDVGSTSSNFQKVIDRISYHKSKPDHIFFASGSALQSFTSFGIDRSTFTTPSESIQSIVPDRIIAMSRDEIPVINALLNRNKFVQKIYCILACHFLAIFIFLLVVNFIPIINLFFAKYGFILFITFIFNYLFLEVLLLCNAKLRQHFPINYVFIILFTISLAMILASTSAYYNVAFYPLYGIGLTTLVFYTIALIAFQDKWDTTSACICIFIPVYIGMLTGVAVGIMLFTGFQNYIMFGSITSVIILIDVLWLIYVTRQIAVDNKGLLYSEEYICRTLTLFINITLFFMFIVKIIKYCRNL